MDRTVQDLFLHSPDIDLSLVSAERHADACKKRCEQLKHWQTSELFLTPMRPQTTDAKIRFNAFECFVDAVKKHDVDYVWSFIRSGQDINGPIVDGLTAIHQAVLCSDLEMIKLLVESHANVNVKDVYGWTPLHASVYTQDPNIVQFLIDKGADPLCVNIDLEFPVDICEQLWSDEDVSSSARFKLKEIKKILLAAIGDNDVDFVRDREQREMLQDAQELLDNPDLAIPICSDNSTPLHVAASKGYLEVLKLLVQHRGLDINSKDSDGWTPLHAALFFEQDKAAEMLVMSGASLLLTTNMNETLEDVCSDEMLDMFASLKTQQPNYGSGLGSIGKRRPSFPLRALRAGSIDQKDKDNERHIMELRSSEDLSPDDSPELPRKTLEVQTPSGYKGHSHTSKLPTPIPDTSFSNSDPHLLKTADRLDPSEKYSHYGPKSLDGAGGRRTSHPVLPVKEKAPAFAIRELGSSKLSPKSLSSPLSVPTRSDIDPRYPKPAADVTNDKSVLTTPKSYSTAKHLTKAPSTPQTESSVFTDLPGLSRSTSSEITRRTCSRKSLDGRRKTQPVDQDSLTKAIEDLNSDKAMEESHRHVGENGHEESADVISPNKQSQANQDTPNSKTESRFRISKTPSKDTFEFSVTDRKQSHTGNSRIYSDLSRTSSQNREQRPWPVSNRVSAIIGNFEKSDRPAPSLPAVGSSSSSSVSVDSFLKEDSVDKPELREKEVGTQLLEDNTSSPAVLRRDRTSSSSTSRKVAKQIRRSTGISQDDVIELIARESLQENEDSYNHNSHSNQSAIPHSLTNAHAPVTISTYQTKLDSKEKPDNEHTTNTNTNTNTNSKSNSKEDKSAGDIPFLKKLYEQDQILIKRLQEEATQLKIEREMALSDRHKMEKSVSQLNRKLADTTRAYEQEKKERTRLDFKLKQLETSEQRNHVLEAEKQRTEDENKKLIEVIKSLTGSIGVRHK
ncbi:Protein phosphatase 1 regulatory subunit 12A [Oopsacas minuta]|uniref:Protein phosphatase 1 regulatory subunit 12A n=1 Tax=Oopsacas minuta TaxID=111878 RepID=A0AAV7KB75_9METZ|nr:Protein phosphatase 1 regulatory subunit 12A [Oopsacas minuta]